MTDAEKMIKPAWENFERFVLLADDGFFDHQRNEMRRAFYSGFVEGALTQRSDAEQQTIAQEFAEFLDQMDQGKV